MAEIILVALISILGGCAVGYFIKSKAAEKEKSELTDKGSGIVEKAKKEASEIKYNARKEAKAIIKEERDDLFKELDSVKKGIKDQERDLQKKELNLNLKEEEKERELQSLREKEETLKEKMFFLNESFLTDEHTKSLFLSESFYVVARGLELLNLKNLKDNIEINRISLFNKNFEERKLIYKDISHKLIKHSNFLKIMGGLKE